MGPVIIGVGLLEGHHCHRDLWGDTPGYGGDVLHGAGSVLCHNHFIHLLPERANPSMLMNRWNVPPML